MSPTVNGHMYAEARDRGNHIKILKVLVVGNMNDDFRIHVSQLGVLRQYLSDIQSVLQIKYFGLNSNIEEYIADAPNSDLQSLDYQEVRGHALVEGIDLILDIDSNVIIEEINKVNTEFGYLKSINELQEQIEAFLAGNGVAWALETPVWNNEWLSVFMQRDGVTRQMFDYMNSLASDTEYELPEKNNVRHMANRLIQIEYSKLQLYYAIILKRRERRIEQNYNIPGFEVNFHLGNYYFLIAGLFDMLARHLNRIFEMGINSYSKLAIEKSDFLEKLLQKDEVLTGILSEDGFNDWLIWLKDRRNYIAHDATISITSLVTEPENRLSQSELDNQVESTIDWNYLSQLGMSEELINSQRQMVASLIRMQELEADIEDVMILNANDTQRLFLPLTSIGIDFDNMDRVVDMVVGHLYSIRSELNQ